MHFNKIRIILLSIICLAVFIAKKTWADAQSDLCSGIPSFMNTDSVNKIIVGNFHAAIVEEVNALLAALLNECTGLDRDTKALDVSTSVKHGYKSKPHNESTTSTLSVSPQALLLLMQVLEKSPNGSPTNK